MPPHHFVRVFDLAESGFRTWPIALFGLIFVAIGTVLFFLPRIVRALGFSFLDTRSTWTKIFPLIFGGFGLLWTLASFSAMYTSYSSHSQLLANNACKIAEGEITDFRPMPVTGHADESFSVSGVRFRYSDYEITDAFNNSQSHGGPIAPNEYVRICYDPRDLAILRLDIADYRGPKKRYGNVELFPTEPPPPKEISRTPEMPWDVELFVWVFFLSFAGTIALYRPYLKTFFVLSRSPANDVAVNRGLQDAVTVKLTNTVFRWSQNDQAIWLRPRGLNVLQIPVAVAKLSTDASGRVITSQEIRFSSAMPFVVAAFFWALYRMFSVTMPPHFPVLVFLGLFAVLTLIVNFRAIRRVRSRMQIFVEDALSELTKPDVM
ncbi:MAG TPA: hypothetical protein VGH02_09335 [Rhizomicrobium sp.]|jgi:hypothetical protein